MWAGGHHAVSVVLHILNSILLFLILRRMTGALWRSAMVAALFAWHPLHVESVAWVSERKDVLSTFFWMLTIWAYVRYVEMRKTESGKQEFFYALSLVFFALGLMAKPMLVTLPFVLLLLDWWPLRRLRIGSLNHNLNPNLNLNPQSAIRNPQSSHGSTESRPAVSSPGLLRLLLEKAPFLLLTAGSCLVTLYAQNRAMQTLENVPIPLRLSNSLIAYCQYIAKLVWPENMTVIYYLLKDLPHSMIVSAGLFLITVSAVAARLRRTRPYFLMGWLFFLGTLVPVIGLVQVGSQAFADRYSYMPSIGFFIVLCWGLYDIGLALRCRPVIFGVTASAALCAFVAVASRQLGYWKNSEALFRHAIAVAPYNPIAHANYAAYLCEARQLDKAAEECNAALRILPTEAMAHHTLGKVRFLQTNYDAAIPELNAALKLYPVDYLPRLLLGKIAFLQHSPTEAATQASIVLAADPANPEAHCILGEALGAQGKLEDACAQFTEALRLVPEYPEAHLELEITLAKQGKTAEAISDYRLANKIPPAAPDSTVLNNLAWILAAGPLPELRDGAAAVKLAGRACELDHNQQPIFIGTLAAAYAEAGRFDEAVAAAQRAHDLALERAEKARSPAEEKAARELAARNLELLGVYSSRRAYHE
jgi:tetratricopeptide (TPR) repeat protein